MEKILTLSGLYALLLVQHVCHAHWDASYFHNAEDGFTLKQNWMAEIRDDVRLSEMALPGTHDSGAFKGNNWNVVTQCMNFEEQLNYGIRVFDIRVRHYQNSFALHHGSFYLGLNFDDFLQTVENFLEIHQSEIVLFRLSHEHTEIDTTRDMRETLESYLSRYSKYLRTYNDNINMFAARGRFIILTNRTEFLYYGLDYSSFSNIQDYYQLEDKIDLYKKWEAVKAHLEKAANGDRDKFYVNYLSATAFPSFLPYFVASGHKYPGTDSRRSNTGFTTPIWRNSYPDFPRVKCFIGICKIAYEGTNTLTTYKLPSIGGTRTVGIIMADFPGETLIKEIIENNRNLRKTAEDDVGDLLI